MKKRLFKVFIVLLILIVYLIIGNLTGIYIECPIHKLTGLYCPGCGLTRMIRSIFQLDFYQAFRYNQLIFISLPFIIFLFINDLYSEFKGKKSLYKKIPNYIWIILIVITILYGILRNIFPILAPTDII